MEVHFRKLVWTSCALPVRLHPNLFCSGGRGSCFIYVNCIYLHIVNVQHDFYIKWCSRRLTVSRRASHVELELFTLQKHMISPLVFYSEVLITQSLVSVEFCGSMFIPRYFCFILDIVLSDLLRFIASDYSVGIFNLFLLQIVESGVKPHKPQCKTCKNIKGNFNWIRLLFL